MRSHKDYKWYYITTQFNWEGSAVYILVSLNSQKKSRKKVIYFLNLLLIINYLMLQWHLVIIYVSLRSTFQFFLLVTIWSCSEIKGWCSGESTCLPPMWPGFKSRRRRHMWVEFVVGSLLCSERFFSGYSGFFLSSKTNSSKFQFNLERTDTFKRVHINSYVLRG